MKIGQIYLDKTSAAGARQFQSMIESLDRLALAQHVLVASPELARSLSGLPYVTVGPVVSTPVMAYCLMPDVDVAHVHDNKSGQTGLLLTLTRSIPYVLTAIQSPRSERNPILASVRERARLAVAPAEMQADRLVEAYRAAAAGASVKRPENANRRK